jgi:Ca-activated chloride channel homolog
MELIFRNAFYLWSLIVIPIIILIHFFSLKYSRKRVIKFANFIALARVSEKVGISMNLEVLFLRVLVVLFIILSISGTNVRFVGSSVTSDYVIAIDSSASMLAEDLEPNRLDVAKESAVNFVDKLNTIYSSVSIVGFSGTPFVHQILTKDKTSIKNAINEIEIRKIGGTDIGNAIVTGSNVLLSSLEPKILILITDGRDNLGLSLEDAIYYANEQGVLVYTIGIGTEEGFTTGEEGLLGPLGIDESELQMVADETGGRYYNVNSAEDLNEVYNEILNTKRKKVTLDLTFFLLIAGLSLIVLEWVLINTRFKIIP